MTDHVAEVRKYAADADEKVVNAIVKHLGIALRSRDASMVSCSQKSELDRVRQSWLQKKLGLGADAAELDKAIQEVCEQMGKSNPSKSRVAFYYLLAAKFGKLSSLA